jgi:hypothetical protein
MRKIFTFLFLIISINAIAQFKMRQSLIEKELPLPVGIGNYIGEDDTSIFFAAYLSKGPYGGREPALNIYSAKNLVYLSSHLFVRPESDIEFGKRDKLFYKDAKMLNGKMYLFSRYEDGKKQFLLGNEMDKKGQPIGGLKKLNEVDTETEQNLGGRLQFADYDKRLLIEVSPNKKYLATIGNSYIEKDRYALSIKIYDDKLNLVRENRMEYDGYTRAFQIDDSGNLFVFKANNLSKEEKKNIGVDYEYGLIHFDTEGKINTSKFYTSDYQNVIGKVNNKGDVILITDYVKEKERGYLFVKYNSRTKSIEKKYNPFSAELYKPYADNSPDIFKTFKVWDIYFSKQDDVFILMTNSDFERGPIIAMKSSTDGIHGWEKILLRKNTKVFGNTEKGYASFASDNKVFIMYDDNPLNANPTTMKEVKKLKEDADFKVVIKSFALDGTEEDLSKEGEKIKDRITDYRTFTINDRQLLMVNYKNAVEITGND